MRAITRDNWQEIIALDIHPDQYRFLRPHTGLYALAKAYVYPERDHLAIYADGRAVGFVSVEHNRDPPASCNLYTFFIDRHHQWCGYGRAALRELIRLVPQRYPEALSVDLAVGWDNHAAQGMYASVGFRKIHEPKSSGNEWMACRLAGRTAPAEGIHTGRALTCLTNVSRSLRPGARTLFTVLSAMRMIRRHSPQDVEQGAFDPRTLAEASECTVAGADASLRLRERGFVPTELVLLFRIAGLSVLNTWGGTAGNWGRRAIDLDEFEIMVVARKASEPHTWDPSL